MSWGWQRQVAAGWGEGVVLISEVKESFQEETRQGRCGSTATGASTSDGDCWAGVMSTLT